MSSNQFGNYYVQERVAVGGMAHLFLAHNESGLSVAIRALQPQHLRSRIHLRQFNFGCKVLEHLDHPSFPRYYDQGKQRDGLPWVAMEYVPAPNLRERLHDGQQQLLLQQQSLLYSMAAGLSHIHERGFLHMDFKPENLLVLPTGHVKIIDFDLALPRPMKLIKLPLAGTAVYLAPEVLLGQKSDERADIFAFGATAFELLTGRKPFGSGTPQEMFQRAKFGTAFDKPPSILDVNPKFPPKLDRIIRSCLAKNLMTRYPVMSLVVRDLQALQTPEPR